MKTIKGPQGPRSIPIGERLMARTEVQPGPDACWIWTGALHKQGYGLIRDSEHDIMRTTHRVAAELAGLDIEGRSVIHSCTNYACVNPKHLIAGNQKEVVQNSIKLRGHQGWGPERGSKQPRHKCPHCDDTMPRHNMARHIALKH